MLHSFPTRRSSDLLTGYYHGFDFGAQANGASFGRYVISTGEDHFPTQTTPTLGGPNSGPLVGPVVITEINYHPVDFLFPKTTVDNSIDEYIELQNIGNSPAPLYDPLNPRNTWQLRDAVSYAFPTNVTIPAGGYILVVSFNPTNGPALNAFRAAVGAPPTVPVYGPWSGQLDNSQDNIELIRPDLPDPPGTPTAGFVPYILADKVAYHDLPPLPTGSPDGLGATIQRVNPLAYGNDPANWRAALKSPGAGLPTGGTTPTITAQPLNTIGNETYSASFSVTATGSQPIGYQWLFNGQPIRGGIGQTLTLTGLRLSQAGNYSCLVLNAAGSTLSSSAALSVRQVIRISQHPADVRLRGSTNALDYGFTTNNATFSVAATGVGTLRYQWRYNGVNIAGANGQSYTAVSVGLTNDGVYDVIITDDVAPVTSLTARLTVLIPPVYLLVPQNQVVVSNGTFSASTVIRGNPAPFRFEWREISTVRASTVTSETTNFFTSGAITNKLPTVTNTWRLVVFNDAATTGVPFSFTVVALGDTDGDGIPDEWETAYGLNPNSNADRDLDSDGDGMSNLAEYMAGTNPTDSHSNLRVDLTTLPSAAMLQVGVAAGHTGSLQYSDALPGGPWLKLADFTARSTNRVEVIADPGYTNARFYRVVSPQQPGP